MSSAKVATAGGFRVLETSRLFTSQGFRVGGNRVFYHPAPDGQRFLMMNVGGEGGALSDVRPVVVQNFAAELKARLPR